MLNKNNLKTIEAQIVQKRKNDPRPKFSGSYKKKTRVYCVNKAPFYHYMLRTPQHGRHDNEDLLRRPKAVRGDLLRR